MSLKTKSIRASVAEDDGLRICIMRLFNPAKHSEYKPVDEHWLQLAPSEELLARYKKDKNWHEYVTDFNREVLVPQESLIKHLAKKANKPGKTITILCYEDEPDNCHRRLVALGCKMYEPGLELILE